MNKCPAETPAADAEAAPEAADKGESYDGHDPDLDSDSSVMDEDQITAEIQELQERLQQEGQQELLQEVTEMEELRTDRKKKKKKQKHQQIFSAC